MESLIIKCKPFFKWAMYIFIIWWAIYTIYHQIRPRGIWNFTPSTVASLFAIIGFVIKTTIDLFSNVSMKIRILISQFIHSGIEMDISYTTYQNGTRNTDFIYNELRQAVLSIGGTKLEKLKSNDEQAKMAAIINGSTHIIVFKISSVDADKSMVHLEVNAIKSNYSKLTEHWNILGRLKKILILSNGGIENGPIGEQSESYKATLKFDSATPFYRYTVKDLEKKKNKIEYSMEIPDDDGSIKIARNSTNGNQMIIRSDKESFILDTLKKYFLELSEV